MEVPAQPRFVIFDKESWPSGLFCLLNTDFFSFNCFLSFAS